MVNLEKSAEILVCTFGRWCKILYMALRHFRCDQLVIICRKGIYDRTREEREGERKYIGELRRFMDSGLLAKDRIRFIEVEDLNDYWGCLETILPCLLHLKGEKEIGPRIVNKKIEAGEREERNAVKLNITGSTKILALSVATLAFQLGLPLYEVLEDEAIKFPLLREMSVDRKYPPEDLDTCAKLGREGLKRCIMRGIEDGDTPRSLSERLNREWNDVSVTLEGLEGDEALCSDREEGEVSYECTRTGRAVRKYIRLADGVVKSKEE